MADEPKLPTYDQKPSDRAPENTVLIVDDEEGGRTSLRLICREIHRTNPLRVLESESVSSALETLSTTCVHVVLLDKNLGSENGIEAIPRMLQAQPHLKIIMVTGSDSPKDVVSAMRHGAFDYTVKGETEDLVVKEQIKKALEFAHFSIEKARLELTQRVQNGIPDLIGKSHAIIELRNRLDGVAQSDLPVLFEGESGVGKTTATRYLHERRNFYLKDSKRPYFEVNIAALSPGLVEAELFGSEKGSFTGSTERKQGYVELANGGTLFLDEVGEISLSIQKKLLLVLSDGTFFRVGGKQPLRSSFKLVCATNRDLKDMVRKGKFRHDLYNRISTFPVYIPSLKDRREDVAHLIRHLLPKLATRNRVFAAFEDIPKDFIAEMKKHPPEANIKGLEHEISRLLVLAPKDHQGRPIMKDWRDYTRNGVRPAPDGSAVTLQELLSLPFDVVNPTFPGFVNFMDTIARKVFEDAARKFRRNRDIAKVLKVSDAAVSLRMKQFQVGRNEDKPTAPKEGDSMQMSIN